MEKKREKVFVGKNDGKFHRNFDCEILNEEMAESGKKTPIETNVDPLRNDPFFCRKCFPELFD
jgi:hypothetical protein